MTRWRLRTKAIFLYIGSLVMIVLFFLMFALNGNMLRDSKAEVIQRRNILMKKAAVDRIGGADRFKNLPPLPDLSFNFPLKRKHEKPKEIIKEIDVSKYNDNGVWTIPPIELLPNVSVSDLAKIYHGYILTIQYNCKNQVRYGKITDGGWEVCEDNPFILKDNELVYSFGIDNDFSFDDSISKTRHAKVFSFDPSMKKKTHHRSPLVMFQPLGLADYDVVSDTFWKMSTLLQHKTNLGHTNDDISLLKLDIEEWEWKVLPQLIKSHSLDTVKQLLVELHLCDGCSQFNPAQYDKEPDKQRYVLALTIFQNLYDLGFRLFWTHKNRACAYTSKYDFVARTACHEVHFVNIKIPKEPETANED